MTEAEVIADIERYSNIDSDSHQEWLATVRRAGGLVNIHRSGVFPIWNHTGVMTEGQRYISFSTAFLFHLVGVPLKRLKEVYEFGSEGYIGKFHPEGRQALADILVRSVRFYHSESYPYFASETGESFYPTTKRPGPLD